MCPKSPALLAKSTPGIQSLPSSILQSRRCLLSLFTAGAYQCMCFAGGTPSGVLGFLWKYHVSFDSKTDEDRVCEGKAMIPMAAESTCPLYVYVIFYIYI